MSCKKLPVPVLRISKNSCANHFALGSISFPADVAVLFCVGCEVFKNGRRSSNGCNQQFDLKSVVPQAFNPRLVQP